MAGMARIHRLDCSFGMNWMAGMKSIVVGLFVSLLATQVFADDEMAEVQAVIDKTVWKAFQSAFERLDGEALNSVYADSVLRVTPDGVDTSGDFKRYNLTRFQENKARGERIALDFWFDSRRTSKNTSYDVGFYRIAITGQAGETDTFYGQFYIVLKNIDGQWLIVQAWIPITPSS